MDQMTKPDATVIDSQQYGRIEHGFMKDKKGKIFFLATHGNTTIPFPVLSDGSVLKRSNLEGLCYPHEVVDLVHPSELGIDPANLRWTDPPDRQTS